MRAAAAERGRKKSGPSARAHARSLGLHAFSSAFAEAWPRWAYGPSRARCGAGAGAEATAAAVRGWVPRFTGSEL